LPKQKPFNWDDSWDDDSSIDPDMPSLIAKDAFSDDVESNAKETDYVYSDDEEEEDMDEPGEKWFSNNATYDGDESLTSDDDMPGLLSHRGYDNSSDKESEDEDDVYSFVDVETMS
jgi:hypothetical protein